MRSECPWLTELPSAYLKRHVRFGTHRLERPADPAHLWTLLRPMDGAGALMYSSNYPHWDMEEPAECQALASATPEDRERVAWRNAAELYGVTMPIA
jgi:uncharacterized protein